MCKRVGWAFLRAIIFVALLAGCAATSGRERRATLPQPFEAAGLATVGLGSLLHLHPTEGAPRTIPIDHEAANPSVTWLGQSSFLIRLAGKVILTDPMFSETLELHLPLKPQRLADPPPNANRLRRVDVILISHLDHDHFDMPTLQQLAARFPDALLLMPQGTETFARKTGFRKVKTVPVWDTRRLGGLKLTALPAAHFGRRDVVGLARTKAIGWAIRGGTHNIYFSGDTGYSSIFRQIRQRQGRFDIALVTIGSWKPERVFAGIHMNPDDALQAASTLGARLAIGHHWGTFNFGRESPAETRRRFLGASAPGVRPVLLDIGETLRLG
ncbi:hypothetical protein CSC94_07975 [Zhengella mangrovi]|uniref:Metallo-beta-lactamase domain-containing protein n=1 Tax=Zhengella mangrovi TaxID=1982044 RepID=A0A2G1QPZ8_9HYPH|nr:hypothetical protein CSC94_07975 [Zhengella mangrovi]